MRFLNNLTAKISSKTWNKRQFTSSISTSINNKEFISNKFYRTPNELEKNKINIENIIVIGSCLS
jgi:hypothetical protein